MAQTLDVVALVVVPGIPQVKQAAVAQNPTALADFRVPMPGPGGTKDRVAASRRPLDQLARKL